jgi:hypothetical protein
MPSRADAAAREGIGNNIGKMEAAMQDDPMNHPAGPAGSLGRREEFLVSSINSDLEAGGQRLKEFEDTARNEVNADVLKVIDNGKVLRTVVVSCTPALAQQLAARFPDLIIERNQPLQMF